MRELYPQFERKGKPPGAGVLNDIAYASRIATAMRPGSYTQGQGGMTAAPPPHVQRTVQVTGVVKEQSGWYSCRPVYWAAEARTWQIDLEHADYLLDIGVYGIPCAVLRPGFRVTAWWDDPRGAWVPTAPVQPIRGLTVDAITRNGAPGTVKWVKAVFDEEDNPAAFQGYKAMRNVDDDEDITCEAYAYMFNLDATIPAETAVILQHFGENMYEIVNAWCTIRDWAFYSGGG